MLCVETTIVGVTMICLTPESYSGKSRIDERHFVLVGKLKMDRLYGPQLLWHCHDGGLEKIVLFLGGGEI